MSKDYLDLIQRVIDEGVWVTNHRTGKRCLTVINADFEYDCSKGKLPILTTKKAYWRKAVAEMLGYLRGYTSAYQFRALGTDTWDENSNAEAWQKNPHCKGADDMGRCYGAQGRDWRAYEFALVGEAPEIVPSAPIDQLRKVYNNLCSAYDDRGEIITYWNVGELGRACLRPCLHTHIFSVLEGTLYLTSYQRSDDLPLGHGFNQIQVAWFLMVMAQITGLKAGVAYHKIVNAHIYEDQLDIMVNEQMGREPYKPPTMKMNSDIKTLEDLETWVTVDDFSLHGYKHHPPIIYPFSV